MEETEERGAWLLLQVKVLREAKETKTRVVVPIKRCMLPPRTKPKKIRQRYEKQSIAGLDGEKGGTQIGDSLGLGFLAHRGS